MRIRSGICAVARAVAGNRAASASMAMNRSRGMVPPRGLAARAARGILERPGIVPGTISIRHHIHRQSQTALSSVDGRSRNEPGPAPSQHRVDSAVSGSSIRKASTQTKELEMLKLYGSPPTRALRVIWLLNELGLEYERCPVDFMRGEARQAAFLALNPAAKVPVLVDGDIVLTESAAIQLYLAEKHPEAGL